MPKYKEEILAIVNASHEHPTAERIFTLMREQHPAIAMATVYNNLNRLCEAGSIQRIHLQDGPDRFDRAVRHDHLVCSSCGHISDVSVGELTSELSECLGLTIEGYDLRMYYTCPSCAERARQAQA